MTMQPTPPPPSRHPLISDPPQTVFVIALCLLYVLTGLFGRDPWKGDDAEHIAVALGFARSGEWLIPRLAGQISLDGGPLYHWTAALAGMAGEWVGLTFADAARLASALFVSLWLLGSAGAARELYGAPAARIAPLIGIASIGAITHLHDAQSLTVALAAIGLTMWALALIARRPVHGAAVLGLGLALSGLGTGLWLTALLLVATFTMPLLPVWRTVAATPGRMLALPAGALAGSLLAASWLFALHASAPALAGRVLAAEVANLTPDLDALANSTTVWLKLLAWYAWPALPVALWALWQRRNQWRSPVLMLPLTVLLLLFVQLAGGGNGRNQLALPMLAPLAVLGSSGWPRLRRGAANALDWFGIMTFTLVGALVWLGWIAMVAGWPERLARTFARLEPGFTMPFSWPAVSVAAVASLAWMILLWRSPRTPTRGAVSWACGVVLIWLLVCSLWLPWVDYGRSYRDIARQLAGRMPADTECVVYSGLQESQRAALYYFLKLKPLNMVGNTADACKALIAYHGRGSRAPSPGEGWTLEWEGRRPGDRHERFLLYLRE
ncbi:ArnT family glycosyltransferase [Methyloversatilis thermotolerans]|uniref:ArnT family glycosyltransferase n=1 Tax=Methyloversatilis thermotolerans TaxID=1346290 RepID=UPI00039BB084|nr:hypothetical protein [Methyloversatilis thermotolerans]